MKPLINLLMKNGSRHFISVPESYPWEPFRDHMANFTGLVVTKFSTDHVTEVWIDFSYERHAFTINNQFGDFWFFVSNPNCPDDILKKIASHAEAYGQL